MSSNRTKKVVALAALGVFAFTGGIAIAYYTTDIDVTAATGTATVAPNQASNIVATFVPGSGPTALVPGAPAQPFVLNLRNDNSYAVAVDGDPLSLDFANMTSTVPGCTNAVALLSAADVSLTGADAVFDAGVSRDVTFAVAMANSTTVDQTPCAGATFTIPVVVKQSA